VRAGAIALAWLGSGGRARDPLWRAGGL